MQRLELSGAVRPLQWSLGVKRLMCTCLIEGKREGIGLILFFQFCNDFISEGRWFDPS